MTKLIFEDTFSFCLIEKFINQEIPQSNLGAIVKQFENGINYEWKLIKIESYGNK
jgi:hypothetical protein